MVIRIVLYWFAALLLSAHFLRAGDLASAWLCVMIPCAFLYRRRYTLVLLQALAYGAVAGWLYIAWQLIELRRSLGHSWSLAAAILGAVALFTALAGLLLNSRVMRERYP
jgi:hypothetical protein